MSDNANLHTTDAGTTGQPLMPATPRYRIGAPGPEGTSTARDTLLDRPVLLQRADGEQAAALQRQAQLLGRLDHAGIGPLLDLAMDEQGTSLVLRDVGGLTLTEAVMRRAGGEAVPALDGPSAVIVTVLKLCDILACAHARLVVHHRVTPDQVRLGEHGQVVLSGWTAALDASATKRFVGDSAATGDNLALDGKHEDIRGVGRCLFTALTGEAVPLNADGTLGEPDPHTSVAQPLLAVVRQAIASDATRGYQSIGELAADLARILDGSVPAAQRPGSLQLARGWMGRHRLGLSITAVILAVAGTFAVRIGHQRMEELRAWGPPLVEERFDDASWTSRWEPRVPETWAHSDGRMLTTGLNDSSLIFKRRLTPPFAVEYTARIGKGAKIGDLSLWWCEEPGFLADQRIRPYSSRGWLFQLGAYENSYASITRMPSSRPVAMSQLTLVPEHDYRVRVEIENCTYRVFVDGTQIMEHTDLLPAGSGYVSLFGYFPGKVFDDVRIRQRELPSLISPLSVGDSFYQEGLYAQAASQYARVTEAAQDAPLIDQALFRQGLSERRGGDPYRSLETWKRITDPHLRGIADCLALQDQIAGADHGQALERFRWFWNNRPHVHGVLTTQWLELSSAIMARKDLAMGERMRWYDLREELFPNEPVTALSAAQLLLAAGRLSDVLQRFPDDHRACASALLALGRNEELLAKPWANSRERGQAMYNLGRLEEMVTDQTLYLEMRALALVKLGRIEEAMAEPWSRPWALLFSGRAEELLDQEGVPTALQNAALMASGRMAEAAGAGRPNLRRSGNYAKAKLLLGGLDAALGNDDPAIAVIAALAAGRTDQAKAARARIDTMRSSGWRDLYLLMKLIVPLIDRELGTPDALHKALSTAAADPTPACGGLLRLIAAAALDPAAENALQATVWRTEAKAWLQVARALHGEWQGDRPAALAAWRGFLGLPAHERLIGDTEPSALLELCAAWRITVLAAP